MQITFKASRKAGRTTWLVESILDHIEEKYPLKVLVVTPTREQLDSMKERITRRAQARGQGPIACRDRYNLCLGDHRIMITTPSQKGIRGFIPDIMAIDDMDLFSSDSLLVYLPLYDKEKTLLLMTELENE